MTLDDCRQVAARIWCDKQFSHVTMDTDVAEDIARKLFAVQLHDVFRKNAGIKSLVVELMKGTSTPDLHPLYPEWSNSQRADAWAIQNITKEVLGLQ